MRSCRRCATSTTGPRVAFLAVTAPRENEVVVGSACYFVNSTTNLAEIAFMVAPEWQGQGVGTDLQARLQEYAIGRGVRGFIAGCCPATRECCVWPHTRRARSARQGRGIGARDHPVREQVPDRDAVPQKAGMVSQLQQRADEVID